MEKLVFDALMLVLVALLMSAFVLGWAVLVWEAWSSWRQWSRRGRTPLRHAFGPFLVQYEFNRGHSYVHGHDGVS